MRSDLFCAFSLSALLVACAHDKGNRAEHNPPHEAQAEAEHAQRQAAADRDHDGVDSDGDGHDKDRIDRDGDGRDKDHVALPERSEQDRARMATAGDELPRDKRDATNANEGTKLSPLDQGNSEIDIDLTQRIRKAVMDDDALSFKAKNVKIITRDGHVTLRGSVKTPEEKAAIGKTAIAAAGVAHVTNQIEISE